MAAGGLVQRALRRTLVAIIGSIVALVSVGLLDVWSEEQAALEAFAEEQAIVARSLTELLAERLAVVRKDALLVAEAEAAGRPASRAMLSAYADVKVRADHEPPLAATTNAWVLSVAVPEDRVVDMMVTHAAMTSMFSSFERPAQQVLFLLPPGDQRFHASDGRSMTVPPLAGALRDGLTSLRVAGDEAARLGLSPRVAVAGLAGIDAGDLGRWGIATVVSAERLRDRERRARTRVVLGVLIAAALVASFGSLALRRQRRELELSRALAVAAVEREHEERLDAATRAATLGTLAMGIAHEISTPASVIQGRAEQLASRVAHDERAKAAVEAITDQAARISQVVRGFLSLARGDASSAEPVSAAGVVAGATTLVEHRFAKAGVALRVERARDAVRLHGDRRLLEHALVNLLLNACDACAPGGEVQVHTRVDASRRAVTFEVLDNGGGISPEHAAHVTAAFFTTKEAGKGTGLGLAITSEIVRAHRGKLELEPRAPRGTRAAIVLPLTGDDVATPQNSKDLA